MHRPFPAFLESSGEAAVLLSLVPGCAPISSLARRVSADDEEGEEGCVKCAPKVTGDKGDTQNLKQMPIFYRT